MSSAVFKQLWLDTDTFIDKLTPAQYRKVRALCEKFYNAGCKQAATRVPPAK